MSKVLTKIEIDQIISDLRDKSLVDETIQIIRENILHFEDQDGIIIESFSLIGINLEVEYMRKKIIKTAKIDLSNISDFGEYGTGEFLGEPEKISKRYSNSVNNFMEYLSISSSVKLTICYEVDAGWPWRFKLGDTSRFSDFKNGLKYLQNICKIDGIDFELPKLGLTHKRELDFRFTKEIDPKKFQTGEDPLDVLPKNIIDDFKKFAQRLNMKRSDKSELINLLSKADWGKKD